MRQTIAHPIPPLYDKNSRVLILGTMPSPVSRERAFYYAHPQNRFWRVLCTLLDCPACADNDSRRRLCLTRGVALTDVLKSCTIEGASDASIQDAVPNDLSPILNAADIRAIFTTGQTAGRLYRRLCEPLTGRPAIVLPSTSPANAAMRLETLIERYRVILPYLAD